MYIVHAVLFLKYIIADANLFLEAYKEFEVGDTKIKLYLADYNLGDPELCHALKVHKVQVGFLKSGTKENLDLMLKKKVKPGYEVEIEDLTSPSNFFILTCPKDTNGKLHALHFFSYN